MIEDVYKVIITMATVTIPVLGGYLVTGKYGYLPVMVTYSKMPRKSSRYSDKT